MGKAFRFLLLIGIAFCLVFNVSGCSKKKVTDEEMAAGAEDTAPKPGEPGYQKIYEEGMAAKEESLDAQGAMQGKTDGALEGRTSAPLLPIYFDFDKSNIKGDQRERLAKNAAMFKNQSSKIRIEGNCDERGTNEYNMALGERRALSAKKYLTNLGIHKDRMHTISFGEEKPLLRGHDEYSWAQNRRDDFIIVK